MLTGAALLFKGPLAAAIDPAAMTRQNASGTAPLSTLHANAARAFPGYRVTRIFYPEAQGSVFFAQLSDGDGAARYATLDPGSAQVLASGTIWRFPLEAALQFHYRLLDGRTGMAIVLANGLALALLAGSGLGFWWPGRRRLPRALAISHNAPARLRLRQWHRSLGVILSLVVLFSAVTGALLVAPDLAAPAGPPAKQFPAPGAGDIDLAINRATGEFPQAAIRDIRFPAADRIDVNFRAPRHNTQAVDVVSVQLSDASLVKRLPAEQNPALWIRVLPLHNGTALGLPGRLFLLIEALVLVFLAMSGPWMWWQARRSKRRKP